MPSESHCWKKLSDPWLGTRQAVRNSAGLVMAPVCTVCSPVQPVPTTVNVHWPGPSTEVTGVVVSPWR